MNDKGFAPEAGFIKRNKGTGKIESTMEAEDIDAHIEKLAESIHGRVTEKINKKYPEKTVLLVAFDHVKVSGFGAWAKIYQMIKIAGGLKKGSFSQICLFNNATNQLQLIV